MLNDLDALYMQFILFYSIIFLKFIPFLYEVALLTCHSDWNESGRKNLAIAYVHTELVLIHVLQ